MHNVTTNLLPSDRRAALRRAYFLRLGVVAVLALTGLVVVYAVLLVPTYLFLSDTAVAKQAHLKTIESALASSDEAKLSARLSALSNDAAVLVALGSASSPVSRLRDVLNISRTGVTLFGLSYTPGAAPAPGVLRISGTAATRDSLRQYQLALQAAPFVATADLPVSAYAKDANIAFTITITLSTP